MLLLELLVVLIETQPTFSAKSIRGATSLQGPHQVAQKSTSTGLSLCWFRE